jgi:hypothetical protein
MDQQTLNGIIADALGTDREFLDRAVVALDRADMLSPPPSLSAPTPATTAACLVVAAMGTEWPFFAAEAVATYARLAVRLIIVNNKRVKVDFNHHTHAIQEAMLPEGYVDAWPKITWSFLSAVSVLIGLAAEGVANRLPEGTWPVSLSVRRSFTVPAAHIELGHCSRDPSLRRELVYTLSPEVGDHRTANERIAVWSTISGAALRAIGEAMADLGGRLQFESVEWWPACEVTA